MNRRNFLKMFAVASSAAALGMTATGIVISNEKSNSADVFISHIREEIHFDITRNDYIVRYDVLSKNVQLFVSFRSNMRTDNEIKSSRALATKHLTTEMNKRGIAFSDLIPLSDPEGLKTPEFSST